MRIKPGNTEHVHRIDPKCKLRVMRLPRVAENHSEARGSEGINFLDMGQITTKKYPILSTTPMISSGELEPPI